ncbi:hypothetical protein AVEN_100246-1 [Araneus ventricosus]|uniref:Uncharacterized protein n=1 Tax=Araneus ventricosus TaxID=182803 RepID=A0A4Y2LGR6_ARAVE|nr:hypothetical protein AVEN_100246-1 [Araneus ventricosus]
MNANKLYVKANKLYVECKTALLLSPNKLCRRCKPSSMSDQKALCPKIEAHVEIQLYVILKPRSSMSDEIALCQMAGSVSDNCSMSNESKQQSNANQALMSDASSMSNPKSSMSRSRASSVMQRLKTETMSR